MKKIKENKNNNQKNINREVIGIFNSILSNKVVTKKDIERIKKNKRLENG